MSFFHRPYALVWRQSQWQSLTPAACVEFISSFREEPSFDSEPSSCAESSEASEFSIDQALKLLATFLRGQKSKPTAIFLPDNWLQTADVALQANLPESLHFLAAHAKAETLFGALSEPHRLSYLHPNDEHPSHLKVALLEKEYHDAFIRLGIHQVYSETLASQAKSKNWRAMLSLVTPFQPFHHNYLEQQREHRLRNGLFAGILGVALIGGIAYQYLLIQTPIEPPVFDWPWPAKHEQNASTLGVFNYVRSLPSRVRLDAIHVQNDEVILNVTGSPLDLKEWQEHWPNTLPPLTIEWGVSHD